MKVALVHDYLKGEGGAEQVLLALHEIYPRAPIYTIFSSIKKTSALAEKFSQATIVESWFGGVPFKEKLISPLRFLIPLIFKSFDFGDYDLVISSASWAITKGFGGGKVKEICYCHTPPRYLYGYETSRDWQKNIFLRIYATVVNHFMRLYDFRRAQKVDFFIANSREVKVRIKKFYRREAAIIYPPVEIPEVQIRTCLRQNLVSRRLEIGKHLRGVRNKGYFLTGGRLEKPKNFDLIIKACNELKAPLKIYGVGPQKEYLQKIAFGGVEFLGPITDKEKFELLAGARAFIAMATEEDFGITPVEAMAAGRPVIAFRGGGYLETVIEGKTGIFFGEPTAESLVGALREFEGVEGKIKPEECRKQARKFSKERFDKEIREFVKEKMRED